MNTTVFLLCSVLTLAGASQLAHSTTNAAMIHGVITDASGGVIAGAMITITTPHWSQTVSTNEVGEYLLEGLDGTVDHQCKVTVRYGGFAPFEKSNVILMPGKETEADAKLEVHEVRQTVTVYE